MPYTRKHTPQQGQTGGLHGGSKRAKGQGPRAGYDDKRYRASRARLKAVGNHVCKWCHHVIDMQLPTGHPLAWSCDHIVPRAHLHPLDDRHWHIDNMQELHARCNSARGDKPMPAQSGQQITTSIQW